MIPIKNRLLMNFSSCINWEEKYTYIIELGQMLPKFPEKLRINKYLITGCQSHTWIALVNYKDIDNHKNDTIKFYGDSNSIIIKGVIAIIFSLYHNLKPQTIIKLDLKPTLDQLGLTQHLTIIKSQGILFILREIKKQANILLEKDYL